MTPLILCSCVMGWFRATHGTDGAASISQTLARFVGQQGNSTSCFNIQEQICGYSHSQIHTIKTTYYWTTFVSVFNQILPALILLISSCLILLHASLAASSDEVDGSDLAVALGGDDEDAMIKRQDCYWVPLLRLWSSLERSSVSCVLTKWEASSFGQNKADNDWCYISLILRPCFTQISGCIK